MTPAAVSPGRAVAMVEDDRYEDLIAKKAALPKTRFGDAIDPKLRLRGVEGLWVADASVMPSVPRGHPNAVVAMIARRAAGWIEAAVDGTKTPVPR